MHGRAKTQTPPSLWLPGLGPSISPQDLLRVGIILSHPFSTGRAGSSVPFLGLHFRNPGASLGVTISPARPLLFDTSSSQTYMCVSYMLACYFKIRQMEKTPEFRRKCQDCRCLQGTWVGARFLKVGF